MPDQTIEDLELIERYRHDAEPAVELPRLVPGPALPRRFPDSRRIPLPWPGPGDGGRGELGRVLLGFGAVRYRYQVPDGSPGAWTGLGRAVPSGGAYHPGEVYCCWPGTDDLAAGVYHYDPLHHALEQLAVTELAGPAYVLSCRVWKNAQKYGNFGYRLGCADLGVMAGQLLALLDGARVSFLFDQPAWDTALGLPSDLESVYAIVHPPGRLDRPPPGRAARELDMDRELAELVRDETRALHRGAIRRPRVGPVAATDSPPGFRPRTPPGLLDRRSAGAFRPGPLPADLVMAMLSEAAADLATDLPMEPGLSLYCVVTDVAGIAPGAYRYDPARHRLVRCGAGDATTRLAAAVWRYPDPVLVGGANVFTVGEYRAGSEAVGPRWYRVVNMLAGVAVQRVHLAAAAHGLAARARLGFHRHSVDALLGLPADQTALIQVALGHPAPEPGLLELMLL